MQRINKRAISNIVVVVLLILVSIGAITIIWGIVNKSMVKLSPEMPCFEMKTSMPVEIINSCYNVSSNNLMVTLKRKTSSYLNSLNIIVNSPSESSRWIVGRDCEAVLLNEGQTKTYFLNASLQESAEVSLVISGCLIETQPVTRC